MAGSVFVNAVCFTLLSVYLTINTIFYNILYRLNAPLSGITTAGKFVPCKN